MTAELAVVIPTFNERDNIAPLVERLERTLTGIAWEAVFVDDDSPDGSAAAARAVARVNPRVRVIQRIGRRGLASACVEGVLSSSAPYFALIDADLQHDETLLPHMLHRLRDVDLDLVVASRYAEGGSARGLDSQRLLISRLAVRLAQSLFRVELQDPMSGFFLMRRDVFDSVVRQLSQRGFKILFDLMASSPRPLKFVELPYQFSPRQRGASKLDSMAAWHFGVLILDKLFGRYVPVRFVMFAVVGGSGICVNVAALYATLALGASFGLAQTVAVLAAMTSNFMFNNLITYRDQRLHGSAMVRGLLSFYGVCSIGAVANVGVAELIYHDRPVWWLAGLAGAAIGVVWNYVASRLLTWGRSGWD